MFDNHYVIGITGEPYSGKSLLSAYMIMYGAKVLNLEDVLQDVYLIPDVVRELSINFGPGSITASGEVDLMYIESYVNTYPEMTEALNDIVSGPMQQIIKDEIENAREYVVVIESSLLFESRFNEYCDYTIYLYAPMEVRKERVSHNNITDFIFKTVNIPDPAELRATKCNKILYNNKDPDYLEKYAEMIIKEINKIGNK